MSFEGMNPLEYQKAAVAMQKQRMEEQPHLNLKPQVEKAAGLPPVEPPTIEAGTQATTAASRPEGRIPRLGAENRTGTPNLGVGAEMKAAGASIALGVGVEAMRLGKELVKQVVREGLGIGNDQRPLLRRIFEPPAPQQPRRDAQRMHMVRAELQSMTPEEGNKRVNPGERTGGSRLAEAAAAYEAQKAKYGIGEQTQESWQAYQAALHETWRKEGSMAYQERQAHDATKAKEQSATNRYGEYVSSVMSRRSVIENAQETRTQALTKTEVKQAA